MKLAIDLAFNFMHNFTNYKKFHFLSLGTSGWDSNPRSQDPELSVLPLGLINLSLTSLINLLEKKTVEGPH